MSYQLMDWLASLPWFLAVPMMCFVLLTAVIFFHELVDGLARKKFSLRYVGSRFIGSVVAGFIGTIIAIFGFGLALLLNGGHM